MCRKAHGAAFSTNAAVPTESLVIQGREHLSGYASSPRRLKQFCSTCGSQLFIRRLNAPELTVVTLGTLDDDPDMDAMRQAALEIVEPDGLIVDCSALHYEWGDLVAKAVHVPFAWRRCDEPPFAVVVGPGCETGLRSLLRQELEWTDADMARVFRGLAPAHDHVARIMRQRSALKRQEMEAAMRQWQSAGDAA